LIDESRERAAATDNCLTLLWAGYTTTLILSVDSVPGRIASNYGTKEKNS